MVDDTVADALLRQQRLLRRRQAMHQAEGYRVVVGPRMACNANEPPRVASIGLKLSNTQPVACGAQPIANRHTRQAPTKAGALGSIGHGTAPAALAARAACCWTRVSATLSRR